MTTRPNDLPSGAAMIADNYSDIWQAYSQMGEACSKAGPLDDRTKRLVKLALSIGAQSEGAVHSHARRALAEGLSADEIKHVALLAIPTLGFPQAVKTLTWIDDITG
jgi:alkylhydroperoxidase/carboxymuconolactone decarboxylase family protein YurZ